MIPPLIDVGAPWRVLPPGVHGATLQEVEERFGIGGVRSELFAGLVKACNALEAAGCSLLFLDGSYVTDKSVPGDYDACWDPVGVDAGRLDPVLLEFSNKRREQKVKYGGELFPSSAPAHGSRPFVDYFQTDKETGRSKGIIRLRLGESAGG